MSEDFGLDPRLEADSLLLAQGPLSQLRLMRDAQFVWCLLVPRRAGLCELDELEWAEQQLLWQESNTLARVLKQAFAPDKLNVAAIGNLVPQLHLHHLVRHRTDPLWPRPVWGHWALEPIEEASLEQRRREICARLPAFFALATPL